ncbi:hypothetical protein BDN71DRAFT_1095348 [Pleurotus eryngii]|uniref:Uncharacterized protein n=1 Tax=Pleurotus eryngii TaxID=5323 RepID=A0A9P5ZTL3_PLEER|nr:hypothetical protein BDN71DRAFT_1095348 [Pleurotus eryngii]
MCSLSKCRPTLPVEQYPASHTETRSGDDWSIGYTQTIYHEDFTDYESQQTGAEMSGGVEFAVHFEKDVGFVDFPIAGFSVFKCFDPTIFPVTFTFEASTGVRRDDGVVPCFIARSVFHVVHRQYTPDACVIQDVPIDFKFT